MMPFRPHRVFRRLSLVSLVALLSACANTEVAVGEKGVTGNVANATAKAVQNVFGASLIPDGTVNIGPSVSYPIEKLVYWGAYIGAAYLILDPWAPNWEIEEARFPEHHVHFQMKMKRYYSGGAGEARAVFNRRARELMRTGGYTGFEVVEYTESLDSSLLGSQRKAEGVIRLVKAAG